MTTLTVFLKHNCECEIIYPGEVVVVKVFGKITKWMKMLFEEQKRK
jgi:hypothetical protein